MLGAIIGDIVGSAHEFAAIPTKTKDFGSLFVNKDLKSKVAKPSDDLLSVDGFIHKISVESHFTDDTVCTIAVARWLLDNGKSIEAHMRETCNQYQRRGYGGQFAKWVTNPNSTPYNSWGNGAPMRVSPVGWVAKSLEEAYQLAEETAVITHNHKQAVKGAKTVAGIIYLLRSGYSKADAIERVINDLDEDGHYKEVISKSLDEIRPDYKFEVSSKNTVPQAILCLIEGKDFEDVIRNAISLGGDADTLAAIAGSMAEVIYKIPDDIIKEAALRLDADLLKTFIDFNQKFMIQGLALV